ncbi:MAG: M12 family metallo-peptidase [Chloroflexi bacterium]|nr:M12 family metallo-peptidase [Chloroflexota bacterium]
MNWHQFIRLLRPAILVSAILAVASPTLAGQPGASLFRDAEKTAPLDQANDPTVVRTRYVDLNLDVLPGSKSRAPTGSTVLLNLFDDVAFNGVLDHVEYKPNGLVWVGSLQGIELSTVNLVTEDGVTVGSINYPGGMYVIRYAENGVQTVQDIDQSQYPPERDAVPPGPLPPDAYSPVPGTPQDDGKTIDVMVVYTPAFVQSAGGAAAANALVDLGVSQTNTSYSNSGITQRIRLVYRGQVNYTEPGTGAALADWQKALNDLTNGVGGLSGVGALRDAYAADEVSLFTNWSQKGTCGIGWYMSQVSPAFAAKAFNVVERTCIDGYYSFAHEMGHNMGAHHDWYVANNTDDPVPYTYVHGWVNLTAKWRTVMAYNDICVAAGLPAPGCTRIPYWSNPLLKYNGAPLGVAAGTNSSTAACYEKVGNPACDADNHLVLNNTAYTVANFRQSTPKPTFKLQLPLVGRPAASTSVPTPGYWLSDNRAHEFYVTANQYVRRHQLIVNISGCGTYKIWHTVDEPIVGNAFSYQAPAQGGMYGSGSFSSAKTAVVIDGLKNMYISECRGYVSGGPWTQTYSWQNGNQVDLTADVTGPTGIDLASENSNAEIIRVQ